MSSSSDSEDYEETKKLAQALDPDFLKRPGIPVNGSNSNGMKGNVLPVTCSLSEDLPTSKRSKVFDRSVDETEFPKPYSLDVTPECQKFIAKQLAKALERNLKEVSRSPDNCACPENEDDTGIKLFASSQNYVTEGDINRRHAVRRKQAAPKKRKKSKKSKAEHSSDSSSDTEDEKLKSVAVTADWVLNSV